MKRLLVFPVLVFLSSPGSAQATRQSIALQKISLPTNGRPAGISNLFFAKSDNRQVITPTFYLIDHRGIIRFSGSGASPEQLKVIERLVEQIRKEMDARE
jgi:hypothetical protein